MASTIKITFNVVDPEPGTPVLGIVNLGLDTGAALTFALREELVNGFAGQYRFRKEDGTLAGAGGSLLAREQEQALNYDLAFSRDYLNVGGQGNLSITRSSKEVTITAQNGAFINPSYTGNVLSLNFEVNNDPVITQPVLTIDRLDTGDCDKIDYNVSVAGDGAPFTLAINGANVLTAWDGSLQTIQLDRGVTTSYQAFNDSGVSFANANLIVPRKLVASEFKELSTRFLGYTDIEIESVNPVAGTDPIEYSLDAPAETTGTAYQTSNSFAGVLDGTYKLFIKDKYGCEVSKTIVATALTEGEVGGGSTDYKYLEVVGLNSIPFSYKEEFTAFNKKNFTNTLGFNDNVHLPYAAQIGFVDGDFPQTQFKSSYPYHNITLWHCDGTKEAIQFTMLQENLGSVEKVDCKLLAQENNVIAVYFDGGNEYEPNTTTIINASTYGTTLPDWAVAGQIINIGTLGAKEIIEVTYNATLGRRCIKVSGTITGTVNDTVQVTFDKQKYNLFQFILAATRIKSKCQITIEAGYSESEINKTMYSECFQKFEYSQDYLYLEWEADKNLGGLVFANTEYKGIMRLRGKFRPFAISDSETLDGDDRTYSLSQSSAKGYRALFYATAPKVWDTINNASGVSVEGIFKINGLELVKFGSIDQGESNESNLSDVTLEFRYGGDGVAENDDEIVLNPSTGVTGGGGTGKDSGIDVTHDGRERYQVPNLGDGFVLVNGTRVFVPV